MVKNNAFATAAAATKIQALARGRRDRRKVEANLIDMIEAMMAGTEKKKTAAAAAAPSRPKEVAVTPAVAPPPKPTTEPPTPRLKEEPQQSHDSDDVDESVIEEEIIVLIDGDTEDEDGKDETVVEIVTYEEEIPKPPPSPPRPPPRKKTAFELYNEQLKKPVAFAAPKRKFGRPKEPKATNEPKAPEEPKEPKKKQSPTKNERETMPVKETIGAPPWTRGRARGLKEKPDRRDLDDISNHMSSISAHSSGADSDQGKNKIGIPWLRPTPASSPEPSSREPSPPPPVRPVTRNPLVNRYLSAAVKRDSSEYERKMAQIAEDRSRGRWQGVGPNPYEAGGEEEATLERTKSWKWKKPKPPRPPPKKFDEGAAIKLQALVRGFLARRKVAKMVDALIEEMMRKMEALRKKEEEERRGQEEEEARRRAKEEEERRQIEKEAFMRREWESYQNRQGLPLWWMECVPHNTISQRQYELNIKKDKVPTELVYKLPPGWEKRFSKPLGAITEEDHGENLEDDNDATLDKILPDDLTDAAPTAKTAAAPEAPRKHSIGPKRKSKTNQRGSVFSMFRRD